MARMTTVSIKIDHPNSGQQNYHYGQESGGIRRVGEEVRAVCVCKRARVEDYKPKVAERVTDGAGMNGLRMTRSRCPKGDGEDRWKDA